MYWARGVLAVGVFCLCCLAAACSNGRGSVGDAAAAPGPDGGANNGGAFSLGGAVSGLTGAGLLLHNNGVDLPVHSNGPFTFSGGLANGAAYDVTIGRQPRNPTQICSVSNGSGVVAGAHIADVRITCSTRSHLIGGSVSGLTGAGLVLQLNGSSALAISSNGRFNFDTPLASGSEYHVTVRTQPSNPTQICTVTGASGAVGDADVGSVRVNCASETYSVGGSVTGLTGSGLVLVNNGADPVELQSSGRFTFPRPLANGASYNVTVRTQPSNPAQSCSVSNGRGVVTDADVTDVRVRCEAGAFTIGGSVQGLLGAGLVLRNNGADEIRIDADGGFRFPTALPNGATYNVVIVTQPANPAQACTVQNGSGTVSGANVTNIRVECVSSGFRIGGRVSKLSGSGLVLQNNGGDDLHIASNGRFQFAQPLPTGATYHVTVARQPSNPAQTCEVKDGFGVVRRRDVRDVEVKCEDARR
jgi:trimeric autotransporter adhesin